MYFTKNKISDLEKLSVYAELVDLSPEDKQLKIEGIDRRLLDEELSPAEREISRLEKRFLCLCEDWQKSIINTLERKVDGIKVDPSRPEPSNQCSR